MTLVDIRNLSVTFRTNRGPLRAIDRLSLSLAPGETLGIVGESGCGKSITSLALMGLLPLNASVTADRLMFDGKDLLSMSERQRRQLRGGDMSMIFQDPMTSLNPSFTVGYQIMEVIRVHQGGRGKALAKQAIELMERVGIPDASSQLHAYPHQLSGGMCQRIMIASAIACRPKLLIADEPTTALDVTIQAQILDLLRELQKQEGMALILITHDLGVVAEMAQRVAVMYAGQVAELGQSADIIHRPHHPYTEGLLKCLPGSHGEDEHKQKLPSIPGLVPDLVHRPHGCQLHPRCAYAQARCEQEEPVAMAVGAHALVKCHQPLREGELL